MRNLLIDLVRKGTQKTTNAKEVYVEEEEVDKECQRKRRRKKRRKRRKGIR